MLLGSPRCSPRSPYRRHAPCYDRDTAAFQWVRARVVERLKLRPGDVVLDVGCGTGLCFPFIQSRVGPGGHIIGIDQSEDMLTRARQRGAEHAWDNVTLVASSVERAAIPKVADAALFCATHDILRSPLAVQQVLSNVRPGGRVVAAGGKWAPAWMPALNWAVLFGHAPYVTSFEGFDRPWSHLAKHVDELAVEELFFGTGYLAVGQTPAAKVVARHMRQANAA